jgi:hypothetical protein
MVEDFRDFRQMAVEEGFIPCRVSSVFQTAVLMGWILSCL